MSFRLHRIAKLKYASLPEPTEQWFDTQTSVVLRVPSVILPLSMYPDQHSNYLINTRHPDFQRAVRLLGYEALPFDPRLP